MITSSVIHSLSTFQPPGGSDNLWNLVAVIKGQDDSLLPQDYCRGIMHLKHLVKFRTVSEASRRMGAGADEFRLLAITV